MTKPALQMAAEALRTFVDARSTTDRYASDELTAVAQFKVGDLRRAAEALAAIEAEAARVLDDQERLIDRVFAGRDFGMLPETLKRLKTELAAAIRSPVPEEIETMAKRLENWKVETWEPPENPKSVIWHPLWLDEAAALLRRCLPVPRHVAEEMRERAAVVAESGRFPPHEAERVLSDAIAAATRALALPVEGAPAGESVGGLAAGTDGYCQCAACEGSGFVDVHDGRPYHPPLPVEGQLPAPPVDRLLSGDKR